MTNLTRSNFQDHQYHLVSPSPWPLFTCISLFSLTSSAALSMHNFSNAYVLVYLSVLSLAFSMFFWFRDIVSEGTGITSLAEFFIFYLDIIFIYLYLLFSTFNISSNRATFNLKTARALSTDEVGQALK